MLNLNNQILGRLKVGTCIKQENKTNKYVYGRRYVPNLIRFFLDILIGSTHKQIQQVVILRMRFCGELSTEKNKIVINSKLTHLIIFPSRLNIFLEYHPLNAFHRGRGGGQITYLTPLFLGSTAAQATTEAQATTDDGGTTGTYIVNIA